MNNYYVYQHTDMDGNIFYIGKGKGNRAWDTKRSKEWNSKSKNGYVVDILYDKLTEEEAFDAEGCMIQLIGIDTLTNIQNTKPKYNTEYYNVLQTIKDAEVLASLTDKDMNDSFIKEAVEFIEYIDNLRLEI